MTIVSRGGMPLPFGSWPVGKAVGPRKGALLPGRLVAARRCGQAALLALGLGAAVPAAAQDASPWAQGLHSRVRLLAGGTHEGRPLAGVEIALDRGFKTYWRSPGDAGLPPQFDWSESDNVGSVDVRWPAPIRWEDAGGVSFTYEDRVTLPLVVTPQDPARPVRLDLTLSYGVCKNICIPAQASLTLPLPPGGASSPSLEAALARVPRPRAPGASGELAVLSGTAVPGLKPGISVLVRAPSGSRPVLFAEAPDNWFISTPAEGEEIAPDQRRFLLTVDEKPKAHEGPVPVRLTLVAGTQAIETEMSVELK